VGYAESKRIDDKCRGCKSLIEERETKRPRHRCGDNIKIYLEMECESVDWIKLVQAVVQWLGLVNTVMNLHIP
jgi:hypothetical protein